jgi:hypothetical protein
MQRRLLSTALIGALALCPASAWADETPVPGQGFPASRYETLWTKSPFSVATPEVVQGSPDYQQTGQHFLLSSEKPVRGLTLISVTRGRGSSLNQAVLQKDGQPITLQQDTSTAGPGALTGPVSANAPAVQPLPAPGAGGVPTPGALPPPRRRLPLIRLPPNPATTVPPPPAPAAPAPSP